MGVSMPPKPIVQNYHFIKTIGKGSYGEVWLCGHNHDGRQYVIKKIDLTNSGAKEKKAALLECRLLSELSHPNIVPYKDSFEDCGFLYIAMGYCEGGDLYTHLRKRNEQLLPEKQLAEWFIQIVIALQHMHERNILHRDLKTQNIFLTRSNTIKVGDLGIARVLESPISMATTLIGTPYYMSPELFANKPYNHKSDIWALGCVLYEMATLKHAFNAKDFSSLSYKILSGKVPDMPKHCSPELIDLLHSMLNQDPEKRPSARKVLVNTYIRKHIILFLEGTKHGCRRSSDISESSSEISETPSFSQRKHHALRKSVSGDRQYRRPIKRPILGVSRNSKESEFCAPEGDSALRPLRFGSLEDTNLCDAVRPTLLAPNQHFSDNQDGLLSAESNAMGFKNVHNPGPPPPRRNSPTRPCNALRAADEPDTNNTSAKENRSPARTEAVLFNELSARERRRERRRLQKLNKTGLLGAQRKMCENSVPLPILLSSRSSSAAVALNVQVGCFKIEKKVNTSENTSRWSANLDQLDGPGDKVGRSYLSERNEVNAVVNSMEKTLRVLNSDYPGASQLGHSSGRRYVHLNANETGCIRKDGWFDRKQIPPYLLPFVDHCLKPGPAEPQEETINRKARLKQRYSDLHSECLEGIGLTKLRTVFEILDQNITSESQEVLVKRLIGDNLYDKYMGKIWQLKLFEHQMFVGSP